MRICKHEPSSDNETHEQSIVDWSAPMLFQKEKKESVHAY